MGCNYLILERPDEEIIGLRVVQFRGLIERPATVGERQVPVGHGRLRCFQSCAYPFDSPKKVVVGEVLNRIDGVSHWKIITDPRFSFANSALLFAFNSRLPAQIRK